jgi:protein FAM32A
MTPPNPAAAFTGGRLKLKGAGTGKKKKKKAKAAADDDPAVAAAAAPSPPPPVDRRTEAQKRHDAATAEREAARVAALAAKSHRERVAEFNEKLAALSEHHDIPKVGPG